MPGIAAMRTTEIGISGSMGEWWGRIAVVRTTLVGIEVPMAALAGRGSLQTPPMLLLLSGRSRGWGCRRIVEAGVGRGLARP